MWLNIWMKRILIFLVLGFSVLGRSDVCKDKFQACLNAQYQKELARNSVVIFVDDEVLGKFAKNDLLDLIKGKKLRDPFELYYSGLQFAGLMDSGKKSAIEQDLVKARDLLSKITDTRWLGPASLVNAYIASKLNESSATQKKYLDVALQSQSLDLGDVDYVKKWGRFYLAAGVVRKLNFYDLTGTMSQLPVVNYSVLRDYLTQSFKNKILLAGELKKFGSKFVSDQQHRIFTIGWLGLFNGLALQTFAEGCSDPKKKKSPVCEALETQKQKFKDEMRADAKSVDSLIAMNSEIFPEEVTEKNASKFIETFNKWLAKPENNEKFERIIGEQITWKDFELLQSSKN